MHEKDTFASAVGSFYQLSKVLICLASVKFVLLAVIIFTLQTQMKILDAHFSRDGKVNLEHAEQRRALKRIGGCMTSLGCPADG